MTPSIVSGVFLDSFRCPYSLLARLCTGTSARPQGGNTGIYGSLQDWTASSGSNVKNLNYQCLACDAKSGGVSYWVIWFVRAFDPSD
jgi:hypothetical protein